MQKTGQALQSKTLFPGVFRASKKGQAIAKQLPFFPGVFRASKKGQGVAIDLFLGIAIFLLLLTAVLAIWSNSENTASRELTEREMQQMATEALDRLVRSPGNPENWEQAGAGEVVAIGLAKADRVLDENKVKQLGSGGLDRSLVAYYKFDEIRGTVTDSSGNNNNGTCYGTAFRSACKSSNCLRFDGINDYVNISSTEQLKQSFSSGILTVTAWIYPTTALQNRDGILGKSLGTGLSGYFDFQIGSASNLALNISNGIAYITAHSADNSLSLNTWQHVAATMDGDSIKLFVNGTQSGGSLPETVKPKSTGDPVKIGRGFNSESYTFEGLIDEARIYNRALSANEIKAVYDNPGGNVSASPFLKQKLLIGDNNYFFRIMDKNPGEVAKLAESGIDPEDPVPGLDAEQRNELTKKIMQTKILRPVVYVYNTGCPAAECQREAVAELTLHRIRG